MGGVGGSSPRRGELHWVYLDPVVGSEQAGQRPAVIVSSDDLHVGPTVVVVLLTKRVPEPLPAYLVRLEAERTGLPVDSVAMCHQVRVVDRRRLVRPTGRALSAEDMRTIDRALLYSLDLEDAV